MLLAGSWLIYRSFTLAGKFKIYGEDTVILCDYCGNALPEDYKPRGSINLCSECAKHGRTIYCKVWHERNKEYHNELNRKLQAEYRKSGKANEAIKRFWDTHPTSLKYEYIKKYLERKAAKFGITITEVNRLSRAGLLTVANSDNLQILLLLAKEINRVLDKRRYKGKKNVK